MGYTLVDFGKGVGPYGQEQQAPPAIAPPVAKKRYRLIEMPKAPNATQVSTEGDKVNRELSYADTAIDAAKSFGTGVGEGIIGLAGLPRDIASLTQRGIEYGAGKLGFDGKAAGDTFAKINPTSYLPGSGDIKANVEQVTGKFYEPKSTIGDYARTIGEFAPSVAAGPGGITRKAAMAIIPGTASETAGKMTEGTVAEPYARAIAGVGAGLATAGRATNVVKQVAKGAPSQETVKATTNTLYNRLKKAGIKYDSNAYDQMTNDLVGKLSKEGFRAKQAPMSADVLEFIAEHRGKSLEYSDFESIRKVASKIMREKTATDTDKTAAGLIIDQLDDFASKSAFIHNGTAADAPRLMKQAREFARRNILGKQIDDMMAKAETYQSGYESGLRNQFSNYLRSNKAKGLSPVEKQAFMDVAKGSFTGNTLGTFGKLGVDFGKLGNRAALLPAAGAAAGYAADSLVTGGATVAAATAAKYAARKMTRNAADRAKSTVLASREAKQEAFNAAKQKKLELKINRAKAVYGSSREVGKKPSGPLKMKDGSTFWNPSPQDYKRLIESGEGTPL